MLTPIEQRQILDEAVKMAVQYVRIAHQQSAAKLNGNERIHYERLRRIARERFADFLKELG